jgi:hypothetical protein
MKGLVATRSSSSSTILGNNTLSSSGTCQQLQQQLWHWLQGLHVKPAALL